MKRLKDVNINTEKYWEDFWTFHQDTFSREYPMELGTRLDTFESILNLGCGKDNLAASLGKKVICSDISELALEFQAKYTPHVLKSDATVLPFDDKSIDCIFSAHVFEHLEDPGFALHEWARIARMSICIVCPHDKQWNNEPSHIWQLGHDDLVHMGLLFTNKVAFYHDCGLDISAEIILS